MEQIDLTEAACLTVPIQIQIPAFANVKSNHSQLRTADSKTQWQNNEVRHRPIKFRCGSNVLPLILSSTKRDNVVPLHNLASNESQMEHIDFTPALWTCHD